MLHVLLGPVHVLCTAQAEERVQHVLCVVACGLDPVSQSLHVAQGGKSRSGLQTGPVNLIWSMGADGLISLAYEIYLILRLKDEGKYLSDPRIKLHMCIILASLGSQVSCRMYGLVFCYT